jgi:hypothetical protein
LKLVEALEGKKILLLPLSGGGLDVRSTDINKLLELYGVKRLAPATERLRGDERGDFGGSLRAKVHAHGLWPPGRVECGFQGLRSGAQSS